jgi:hypothetical protein
MLGMTLSEATPQELALAKAIYEHDQLCFGRRFSRYSRHGFSWDQLDEETQVSIVSDAQRFIRGCERLQNAEVEND